ncbi:MAG: oligoendopeptidase F [Thermomicrobiales bacterium]
MSIQTAEQPTRADIPVEETWDLSSYYPDDAAWEEEFAGAGALVAAAAAHRGSLGESADRLKQALDDVYAANLRIERLVGYAHLRRDEDLTNTDRQGAFDRAIGLAIQAGQQLAYIQPELLQLDKARFEELAADPLLADYKHALDDLGRRREHTRSIEIEELLAASYDVARGVRESFSALNDADFDFGVVKDDDGNDVHLTKGRYQLLMQSKNRDVRRGAYDALMHEYQTHINSLATLHASSVRTDNFYASARGYTSARSAALFSNNIEESVYDSLITAVRENSDVIERFYGLRSRILGIDDLALYDVYVPLAPAPELTYSIDEAIEIVLKGVSALGPQYVDDLKMLFDSRVVDWHETKGKNSGAYSSSVYGSLPVMLMNWNGSMDHVYTLAHEAGHAMHSYYAMKAQPYHYADYTIFSAEIASTVNEVLLTWDLLRSLPEDAYLERFSILDRFADTINGTLIRQSMFADFEHQTHQLAATGQPLTRESLTGVYADVAAAYRPGVLSDEVSNIEWSRVPHFYRGFYVYQYATGISAAIALAKAIRDEGEESREKYLDMLRAGGSDYSVSLLKKAGVDPSTGEPSRAAMAVFDETIVEMESIATRAGFLAADS